MITWLISIVGALVVDAAQAAWAGERGVGPWLKVDAWYVFLGALLQERMESGGRFAAPRAVQVDAWAEAQGFDVVGFSRRVVLADGNAVLKVPRNRGGLGQNRSEISQWQEASSERRKLLAPLLDFAPDGTWLMMQRVAPLDRALTDAELARLREVLPPELLLDLDGGNLGQIRGEPVLVDYADPRATVDLDDWHAIIQEMLPEGRSER